MAAPRDEHDPDHPSPADEGLRSRLQEYIPEIVKRTLLAGLGAAFTTEEAVRRFAQESQLPKEVAGYFVTQAQATKKEIYRIVAGELRDWLERLDLQQLLLKLLTSVTFEINTQVRLIPSGANLVMPVIKPRIKVRRRKADDEETDEEIEPAPVAAAPEPPPPPEAAADAGAEAPPASPPPTGGRPTKDPARR
jgi:hypothetical protein